MSGSTDTPWLRRYAFLTALATFALLGIGGTVTSKNAGMSVPDWPNSYGYNMFLFPPSKWVGGILDEHLHRLVASFVGLLVVGLTRWLGGRRSRLPLAVIGVAEMLVGGVFWRIGGDWKGTGYFLMGIACVVLLAAAIWARNEPARKPLPMLGWVAFVAVQVQGLLGGLRVVLFKDQIGIFHAALAQLFFALLCVIAVLTTKWWWQFSFFSDRSSRREENPDSQGERDGSKELAGTTSTSSHFPKPEAWDEVEVVPTVHWRAPINPGSAELRMEPPHVGCYGGNGICALVAGLTLLILCQLILGATMRHQHAGLSIPDFPLAYGKVWPATDPGSVQLYNQKRIEATAVNPITSFQILLQMVHRIVALTILAGVAFAGWTTRRNLGAKNVLSKFTAGWFVLILAQAFLGAATIWSGKAADVATAHVLLGALSLASGALISAAGWKAFALRGKAGAVQTPEELGRVVPTAPLGHEAAIAR